MPRRTKQRRKARRVATEANNVGDVNLCAPPSFRQLRPTKRVPTELETTAQRVHDLNNAIQQARGEVKWQQQGLQNAKDTLANVTLEQQVASAKLRELSNIPQPSA